MGTYEQITPSLWDMSRGNEFSQLPDDDFLALLRKEYPEHNDDRHTTTNDRARRPIYGGANPQTLAPFTPLAGLSPPSDDSSPSPPDMNRDASSRGQAEMLPSPTDHDDYESALKRKASGGDFEDRPSPSKALHTSDQSNKRAGGRRRSGGAPPQDEVRLLKRKEQNRAAQRAFRERKEKHVKDLEDRVAELQALHHRAQSDNDNLRDLLSRLQNENLALKQGSFTFSVPTTMPTEPQEQLPASTSIIPAVQDSQVNLTGSEMATPASLSNLGGSSPSRPSLSPSTVEAFNWSALQPIDPAILDDGPQITATDGAMSMDFGFGGQSSLPFTTIASDPQFMTFADTYDPPPAQYQVFGNDLFDFDMMHGLESWSQPQPDGSLSIQESSYLDSLFGVPSLPSRHNSQSSSLSPVSHTSLPSMTSNSSPASTFSMPNSSGSTTSEADDHDTETCPKTKEEALRRMKMAGPSPFVDTPLPPTLQRKVDAALNTMVGCKGSHMPMVEMSDKNVEVFSAWRRIMSDPNIQDVDLKQLCDEFTNKARCDGEKVVLEPQGVNQILETLSAKKSQPRA